MRERRGRGEKGCGGKIFQKIIMGCRKTFGGCWLKTVLISLFLFLFSSASLAMDKSVFQSMMDRLDAKDFEAVEGFLAREKESLKRDPEYHVLLLNYAYMKRSNTLIVAKGEPQAGDLVIKGKDTGETVGFIRQGGDEIIVNAIA
jgi:hypothetical protein